MPETKLSAAFVKKRIPPRLEDSNKGMYGHVLVVAGSRGMSGAAYLVALGALRAGAGLVTVAMPESERAVVTHQLPEALSLSLPEHEGVLSEQALAVILDYINRRRVSVLAVGPGLSVHPAVKQLIQGLLTQSVQPLVLDADGLNNINPGDLTGRDNLVITPHPGELARLLGVQPEAVKRTRSSIALKTAREQRLVCVLKGFRTIVTDGKAAYVNPTGNPAMATGGTGDVLTGAIAGLLAQGLSPLDAACAGVYVHGLAGDFAAVSDRGLLAGDLANALPQALHKIGVK